MTPRPPAIAYIAPFAAFIALLALKSFFAPPAWLVFAISLAVIAIFSRGILAQSRLVQPLASVTLGIAVFVIWIGPDVLFPNYRHFPLFSNSLTGQAVSSMSSVQKGDLLHLTFRVLVSIIAVPILEELFWRGWLMRWIINKDFERVPLGTYAPLAFWLVALLFASEHGPYWDVGLITGVLYNWWMVRTKSLWSCILAHAITNALLAWWVISHQQWQYWL